MKDINEVLRRKQAQYAQLGKQIEMLQSAADKLREVASLLAESESDDESAVLTEMDEENSNAMAAKAGAIRRGSSFLNPSVALRAGHKGQPVSPKRRVGRFGSMILRALLVSKDDPSAETLVEVLGEFGVAVVRANPPDTAVTQLAEARFDPVIIDFDDPEAASLVLEACRRLGTPNRNPPLTVALLHDASQIRSILGAGAHFVLTKPITHLQTQNTLRAARRLMRFEQQQACRVNVQAAVTVRLEDRTVVEAILLNLGHDSMEVLAAKLLPSNAVVHVSFVLPDSDISINAEALVEWSSAPGQAGLCLGAMDAAIRTKISDWLTSHAGDIKPDEAEAISPCQLTDLSPGGCYVQTESPFPQSSKVDLRLRLSGTEIQAEGVVRVMHPGHGMGIEFFCDPRYHDQGKIGEFIASLAQQPSADPQAEVSPRPLVARALGPGEMGNSEAENGDKKDSDDDPLLELLRTGAALEEREFLAELHHQRSQVFAL